MRIMGGAELLAQIAVSAAVYAMDKPYDYLVPQALETQLQPGMRVTIPFGRGNCRQEGMVLALADGTADGLKCVEKILDEEPVLSQEQLRLAAFLRERYFCTFYDAVRAILPAGVWYAVRMRYAAAEPLPPDWRAMLPPEVAAVLDAILTLGHAVPEMALKKQFSPEQLRSALQLLRKKHLITMEENLTQRAREKTEQMAELLVSAEEALRYADQKRRSAPQQAAILELLARIGNASVKELCYFTGATAATVRRLAALNLVALRAQQIQRRPEIAAVEPACPLVLNEAQQAAYMGLRNQAQEAVPGVALLYGVTGSGKTAVYLKLIADCLADGKSAILLVPEIALTPQLLQRMASHFGKEVAVLHSGLRVGERYDEWKRIRSGKAHLVVGTRSAVFAPVLNLGLILVDEEQEHTYKSENTPRYHAREIAIYRGQRADALVVLGSATPSVETRYHAETGTYRLYRLWSRYNGRALPNVSIVDLKQELLAGNNTTISRALRDGIAQNLQHGKQTILFLNRRGASRLVVCIDCGYVPECPRCSVSLTYHAANRRLMCHYCGYSEPVKMHCPVCGGHFKRVGAGTQLVQKELEAEFPEVETLRMDADTISAANPHERILRRFREEKIPVLIGTQMVAKGLDFENVTLVGVLDADQSLYVDHFRAAETTFSMITQVVGRAGRGAQDGMAIIQTMTPEHPVIQLAAAQDYDRFYEMEIKLREIRRCPPFSDLITVTFHGADETVVAAAAVSFRDGLGAALTSLPQTELLGPAPAPVVKVNNTYRYRLTLLCRNSRQLRQLLSAHLRAFTRNRKNHGVSAYADVNAYD